LIQAGGETTSYDIHKLFNSIWNKKELSVQWKESIIVSIHKKRDKNYCSNYLKISLLSASSKHFPSIFLVKLGPHVEERVWDHQCGFEHNRSATDQILLAFV
jgi:hypothetical protein